MDDRFKNRIMVENTDISLEDWHVRNRDRRIFWLHDHMQCHNLYDNLHDFIYCRGCGAVLYQTVEDKWIPVDADNKNIRRVPFKLSDAEIQLAVDISKEYWAQTKTSRV